MPDVTEEIAASVRALSPRFDFVFTSGGVGPTHDDVTLRAVADAFAMELVRQPRAGGAAARGLRRPPARARSASWPTSRRARGWSTDRAARAATRARPGRWSSCATSGCCPACRRSSGASSRPCASCSGPGRSTGGRCSRAPARATSRARSTRRWRAFPEVEIGSYPHPEAHDYRVKITLDGRDAARVDDALAWLAARLGDAVRPDGLASGDQNVVKRRAWRTSHPASRV